MWQDSETAYSDEGVGWPSYVDFLSTFVFVLFIFIGSLLYILSGDIQQKSFERRIQNYVTKLNAAGIANVVEGKTIKLPLKGKVDFGTNSANLKPQHEKYLREIGEYLKQAPGSKRIVIMGHADRQPFPNDPFGNWRLSSQRALRVLDFLYSCNDCGYGPEVREQLTLTGEGNINADSEQRNNPEDRRVDVIIDFNGAP
jgi:flagellar motor protein MotB